MKANYQNWMPRGMIYGFAGGAAAALILCILLRRIVVLRVILILLTVVLCGMAVWAILMRRAFSYDGKRQMSRQIIEGTADFVRLPKGGRCLDVGCGSGALTIAVAKRFTDAQVLGVDRWGPEYASFSQALCEQNARLEGAKNTTFQRGDATHLDFPDETFDAVVSNYVYHNIPSRDRQAILLESLRTLKKGGCFAIHDIMSKSKYGDMDAFADKLRGMGYQKVELIDTTRGKFMSPFEATWMALSGSKLLTGIK